MFMCANVLTLPVCNAQKRKKSTNAHQGFSVCILNKNSRKLSMEFSKHDGLINAHKTVQNDLYSRPYFGASLRKWKKIVIIFSFIY